MYFIRQFSGSLFGIVAAALTTWCSCSEAQVSVQLPTYHVTGVSTTVLVPDGGSVYLGGVTNSSIGGSSYGSPFGRSLPGLQRNLRNSSFGSSTSAGGFSVSATIIDHAELDRAVLAEAERRQRARRQLAPAPFATASSPLGAQESRDVTAQASTEADRVGIYLSRARRAEERGQPEIAKIFYRRIAKHGTTSEQELAEARLAAIESTAKR